MNSDNSLVSSVRTSSVPKYQLTSRYINEVIPDAGGVSNSVGPNHTPITSSALSYLVQVNMLVT